MHSVLLIALNALVLTMKKKAVIEVKAFDSPDLKIRRAKKIFLSHVYALRVIQVSRSD